MKDIVKIIKTRYENRQLSFIIGAGFSKNISCSYLSWAELLKDAIVEMHGDEIKKNYNIIKPDAPYREFMKTEISSIVKKYGYLNLASRYVEFKGFHEAIDIYIEERTPMLKGSLSSPKLFLNNNEIEEKPDLSIHQKLINLNAKNIFTFNYDNALDFVAKTSLNRETQKRKTKKTNEYSEIVVLCDSLKDHILKSGRESVDISSRLGQINELLRKYGQPIDFKENNYEKLILDLEKNTTYYSSIRNELKNNTNIYEGYQLIVKSEDISLSERGNNIWKLHGDIATEKYGFDNDPSSNYIITAEDYDKYSSLHEAFVNYMKISLLKDSFCIIGFSGDDPNFISWIKWVSKIIKEMDKSDERIFFIDVTNKELSKDKLLFFKNNNITYLPLRSVFGDKSPKIILSMFFDELKSKNDDTLFPSFWTGEINRPLKNKISNETIDVLWMRYLKLQPDYNQHSINVSVCKSILDKIVGIYRKDKILDEFYLKLLLICIKVTDKNINRYFKTHEIDDLFLQAKNMSTEVFEAFQVRFLRYKSLLHIDCTNALKQTSDELIYEKILNSAFSLDFISMKKLCEDWKPLNDSWKIKRDILLNKVDCSQYSNFESLESSYFFLSMLIPYEYNKTMERLNNIEKKVKARYFFDAVNVMTNNLRKKEDRPNPYGISTVHLGPKINNESEEDLFNFFIWSGSKMNTKGFRILENTHWYKIFKGLYLHYPYPCLYFSLQYGDETKFLKLIAQDYIYSSVLKVEIPNMLNKIFKLMLLHDEDIICDTYLAAFRIFAIQFMKVVDEIEWIEVVIELYNQKANRFNKVICTALSLTKNISFKNQVINDVLLKKELIDGSDNDLIIHAKNNLDQIQLTKENRQNLIQLINMNDLSVNGLYVIFNLFDYLLDNEKENAIHKLVAFDKKQADYVTFFKLHLAMVSYDSKLKEIIVSDIFDRNILSLSAVENGIYPSGITYNDIEDKISFTKEELTILCEQFKESLEGVSQLIEKSDFLIYFGASDKINLLISFRMFLENHGRDLVGEVRNNELMQKLESNLNQINGYKSFGEAVISDDVNIVDRLCRNIKKYGDYLYHPNTHYQEYKAMAYRIIMKNPIEIDSCIKIFCYILSKHFKSFSGDEFKILINEILTIYSSYYDTTKMKTWDLNAEKDSIEDSLLGLYKIYIEQWGGSHLFWGEYKRQYNAYN